MRKNWWLVVPVLAIHATLRFPTRLTHLYLRPSARVLRRSFGSPLVPHVLPHSRDTNRRTKDGGEWRVEVRDKTCGESGGTRIVGLTPSFFRRLSVSRLLTSSSSPAPLVTLLRYVPRYEGDEIGWRESDKTRPVAHHLFPLCSSGLVAHSRLLSSVHPSLPRVTHSAAPHSFHSSVREMNGVRRTVTTRRRNEWRNEERNLWSEPHHLHRSAYISLTSLCSFRPFVYLIPPPFRLVTLASRSERMRAEGTEWVSDVWWGLRGGTWDWRTRTFPRAPYPASIIHSLSFIPVPTSFRYVVPPSLHFVRRVWAEWMSDVRSEWTRGIIDEHQKHQILIKI